MFIAIEITDGKVRAWWEDCGVAYSTSTIENMPPVVAIRAVWFMNQLPEDTCCGLLINADAVEEIKMTTKKRRQAIALCGLWGDDVRPLYYPDRLIRFVGEKAETFEYLMEAMSVLQA